MELDDPRWKSLCGGYRVPYDASHDLRALAAGDDEALDPLFENLYHQGDVGEASYAAVPMLARIARTRSQRSGLLYGLVNAIESARQTRLHARNPKLPDWLASDYQSALREMMALALEDLPRIDDSDSVNQALATIAFAKHNPNTGTVLADYTDDELAAVVDGTFGDG